jgi:uncharacterized protein
VSYRCGTTHCVDYSLCEGVHRRTCTTLLAAFFTGWPTDAPPRIFITSRSRPATRTALKTKTMSSHASQAEQKADGSAPMAPGQVMTYADAKAIRRAVLTKLTTAERALLWRWCLGVTAVCAGLAALLTIVVLATRTSLSFLQEPLAFLQEPLAFLQDPLAFLQEPLAFLQEPLASVMAPVSAAGLTDDHPVTVFAAIGLASFLSSIGGFAFGAICGAMLFHVGDDPIRVVQIVMTCSIANQAKMIWGLRHDFDWRSLSWLLTGGISGLPVGVWLLFHIEKGLYVHALGMFLVLYGGYMLFRRPVVLPQNAGCDIAAGFLGGITGGAMGFPSASVSIWCGTKGWDKDRQRAVFQPFILVVQVAALALICAAKSGQGVAYDLWDLVYVPAGLLGTAAGFACYQKLSDNQFSHVVNVLLIASGVSFLN